MFQGMCYRFASPRLVITRSFSLLPAPCRSTTFACCSAERVLVSFVVKRFWIAAIIFESLYIHNRSPAQQAALSLEKRREKGNGNKKEYDPKHVQPVEGEISTNVTRENGTRKPVPHFE